ncbi:MULTISPECIES: PTS system mannose/fructose/N-acetylgalactosamine-transporter subunit IIB [Enterococcus]|jgi:mannose/fructose/N-acetylgalactosamine-specific phosphotransferase system component IIB|uniref:PTS sugar transporter subunit IIB n=1 Tax=Enterococcus raffinosus TaxID=71452 RepID=A0AAP5KCC4_9ENTE|nr:MULTISPECIES: PTS sugar transporter subunit IIB [Enterococcus]SAZ60477.1 PTS system mannose-specific transporter subunit IIAB [Enterococcus faecium]MBS6432043.1 PTS sugar transporter subunit IIB [Enterococcus raffinosus]MDK7989218.1 PTS sugar transporter subunit IIB [Enterococcus raffinosus]MDT2524107.1 PTS sugar transporter subunit IIB [Enterococcus raffinosus]MDT2534912.1 PTS sugar transporter subunit IIB [Enterococcus raffinosus]
MSEIVLTRIDDRLIHGQVMTAWVKKTRANQILIIDDEVAKDDFMSEILKMSAPAGIDIVVKGLEDAVTFLNEQETENKRLIILVKAPITIDVIVEKGIVIDKLVVGGMGAKANRRVLYKNISASDEERATFKKLIDRGIPVVIHIIPDQKEIDLSKYL